MAEIDAPAPATSARWSVSVMIPIYADQPIGVSITPSR